MNDTYLATARLLTEIAPTVFESGIFALKGGTAINLFLRDMPRLSVDLDLVFTDHRIPRPDALAAINEALRAARDRLAKREFQVQALAAADMGETKLLVKRGDLTVKIEVNTVIRGTVHPTRTAALATAASEAHPAPRRVARRPMEVAEPRTVVAQPARSLSRTRRRPGRASRTVVHHAMLVTTHNVDDDDAPDEHVMMAKTLATSIKLAAPFDLIERRPVGQAAAASSPRTPVRARQTRR